jgi:hypothetical protein
MRFEFEKIASPIYPAYLHLGDYSLALDKTLIASLKKSTTLENAFQMIAGENRYLKMMIEICITTSEETSILTKRLFTEMASL